MAETEYRWLYMTAGTREEAVKLGRVLVEARLVACVNIFERATSLFWWDGGVQEDSESIMVAKTAAARVDDVIAQVKAEHSYDCPCVVALPIVGGNEPFLQWIGEEVSEKPGVNE